MFTAHGRLDAVLSEIAQRDADLIVCLGDVAANGPDPVGAVERVSELGCQVVMGNTDADMVSVPDWRHDAAAAGAPATAQRVVDISLWCANQLSDAHREFLARLPPTVEIDLGDAGLLLALHGSPESASDLITATTPPNELDQMFGSSLEASVLVGGHTHVPMVRRHGTKTVINPGSVGLPFASYGYAGDVSVLDHAAYALITASGPELSIELRQVPIDQEQLSRQVDASGMPHGAWWLQRRR